MYDRVHRRRRVTGGSSPSLPSVLAALATSVVLALREESVRSDVEPLKGQASADMSNAALEVSLRQTGALSLTDGVAVFRARPSISSGGCTSSHSSSRDLAPSSGVCKGGFGLSGFCVRGEEVGLSIAEAGINPSLRKASHKARLATSSRRPF